MSPGLVCSVTPALVFLVVRAPPTPHHHHHHHPLEPHYFFLRLVTCGNLKLRHARWKNTGTVRRLATLTGPCAAVLCGTSVWWGRCRRRVEATSQSSWVSVVWPLKDKASQYRGEISPGLTQGPQWSGHSD